jgi:4-amino-4-deoxy-L-arabinose transferase-like glycosyltransferase
MKQYSSPFDSRSLLWILSILFLIVWFYTLGSRTLVPTDEGRYAEMAREMFVTGDWVTLRLDGIKYFEKPPLQAWMNVITFELFGVGEWQARLWTGLCGLLGIVLVAYTGRKVFNYRVGVNAALVLGSSLLWAASSHYNSLDMAVAGMMTITLCGVLLAQRNEATPSEQRNGMLLCWIGMALAVLSKGLIGIVLPGAVLVIYTFVARDWSIWKRLHLGKGLLIFFAIVVPWFVLVALKNPEHPRFSSSMSIGTVFSAMSINATSRPISLSASSLSASFRGWACCCKACGPGSRGKAGASRPGKCCWYGLSSFLYFLALPTPS